MSSYHLKEVPQQSISEHREAGERGHGEVICRPALSKDGQRAECSFSINSITDNLTVDQDRLDILFCFFLKRKNDFVFHKLRLHSTFYCYPTVAVASLVKNKYSQIYRFLLVPLKTDNLGTFQL